MRTLVGEGGDRPVHSAGLSFLEREEGTMRHPHIMTPAIAAAALGLAFITSASAAPPLEGTTPIHEQDDLFEGDGWTLAVSSYVYDDESQIPPGIELVEGEMLFVYLLDRVDDGEAEVEMIMVSNPNELVVNSVGYITMLMPDGYDPEMFEDPFLYGYSSPHNATIFNYTGDELDPFSTLGAGEWSLVFFTAECDDFDEGDATIFGPGVPVVGSLPVPAVGLGPADINGDGAVNVLDLLIVLGEWGESGGDGDIDGVPGVGVGDLLMIMDAWTS
jgi:hypothetical protein